MKILQFYDNSHVNFFTNNFLDQRFNKEMLYHPILLYHNLLKFLIIYIRCNKLQ